MQLKFCYGILTMVSWRLAALRMNTSVMQKILKQYHRLEISCSKKHASFMSHKSTLSIVQTVQKQSCLYTHTGNCYWGDSSYMYLQYIQDVKVQ